VRRPRCKWEDNTTSMTDIGETGWEVVDSIHLAHNKRQWRAFVIAVMNLRVP
jgi:hypothetical protein